jgi:hypothetical protein
MLFPRILWELSSSISNDPEVDIESSCFQVDGYNVGFVQFEVSVWTGWLNAVASRSVSEHAVTGHLDVEDVLLAIAERLGEDPLDTLTTSGETL